MTHETILTPFEAIFFTYWAVGGFVGGWAVLNRVLFGPPHDIKIPGQKLMTKADQQFQFGCGVFLLATIAISVVVYVVGRTFFPWLGLGPQ